MKKCCFLCIFLLFVMSACGQKQLTSQPKPPESPAQPESSSAAAPALKERQLSVTMSADYPVWLDGTQLSENTKYAVLGHYESFLESYNGDRDVKDPSKESDTYYSESRKYQFVIEQAIKGDIDSEIICVSKSYSIGNYLNDPVGKQIAVSIPYPYFTEPECGVPMILLLNYDPATETYFSIGEPWEFRIEDGTVQVVSRIFGAAEPVKTMLDVEQEDTLYHISISYGNNNYEEPFSGMNLEEFLGYFN